MYKSIFENYLISRCFVMLYYVISYLIDHKFEILLCEKINVLNF